jgi:alpha-galactosidase
MVLCALGLQARGQEAAVALTPPMGWNSWNCFHTRISEATIDSVAVAMVRSGMKAAGYRYVILDDGWMSRGRDAHGHIIPDTAKFPHGIKAVADFVHSLGLKFGLYSSPGRYTCQRLMGSLGHEQQDADDYAAWGVDYLKYDWCRYPSTRQVARTISRDSCRAAFELMRDCLRRTHRPIVYSMHDKCTACSETGALPWADSVGNMHRTGHDITNNWDRMLSCLETTAPLWKYARPGYWNDPDMLEVGNEAPGKAPGAGAMTTTEYRTHFSMWCMVAAPLIAGNDLSRMPDAIAAILTNREMIAIDQDPLGKQAKRIADTGGLETWVKPLSRGRLAVALLNTRRQPAMMKVSRQELHLRGKSIVRDVWRHRDLGRLRRSFGTRVPSHAAVVIVLRPVTELRGSAPPS